MLKKLKSLFIVEEEVPIKRNPGKKASGAKAIEEKPLKVEVPVDPTVKAPSKFIDSLLKAIEANNMEGFDYLEYKQSLRSLSKMEMDEGTMYSSAFAMAQTMGATKLNLLESAKHYQNVLDDEKSKFDAAFQAQQQKQVKSREQKLASIKNSIAKKEDQIKKLQEEIKNLKLEFETKKKEVNSAAAKVQLTRDQFYAAHGRVSGQISSDIEKMNKYLAK